MYQSNRVISLPQDQQKPYVTVFGDPHDEQFRQLVTWFDRHETLNDLKRKSHFATMPTDSTMFATRYASTVNQLPCIRIQSASGEVLCQLSGGNIPLSPEAMANCIDTTLRRRNAQPSPQPNLNYHLHYNMPDDKPDSKPDQPDVFVKEASMFDVPTWAFFALGITAMVAGVAVQWVKEFKRSR